MVDNSHRGVVRAWEETLTLPTYVPPPPDPNPMFLDRRVNQGASGKVYPNPFTDRLSSERVDRPYRAVYLENEYLQLIILPELGGRIFGALDKTNGYDFFYRQHVVKPALIGLIGSWISGGAEFNWPQHHRPSTFMKVDHTLGEQPNGGRTVWLAEHEPMDRTRGLLGITLYPERAYIELRVRLYNRTPFPHTFLWWVNVGVHVNDQYQFFLPPDVTVVTDHSKRAMARFPVSDGTYYGVDFRGVDLRWYRHIPVAASYFAYESRHDFFGAYDHRRRAGVVHIADHHVAPGKKTFTWGTGDFGRAWEHNLTDADGPYIELMAGAYTDNQPDFSWIQPYECKEFCQFWYPIQEIGPASQANLRAAVSLSVAEGTARVGLSVTEPMPQARLKLEASGQLVLERCADAAPGKPILAHVALPVGVAEIGLRLRVSDAAGEEVISYSPESSPSQCLPEPMTPAPPPDQIGSTEELYLTGLHLEQYKHPLQDPEPYWERALTLDPDDVRCNTALGLSHVRRGNLDLAESYLRRAIVRLTRRNPNPRDGEAYYYLGLALKLGGRLGEAYASLYKATWSYAWQAAAYYALAELDAMRADYPAALAHVQRSLAVNAPNLKARHLWAALLRHLGRCAEAEVVVRETARLDPLDYGVLFERVLLARARGDAELAAEARSTAVGVMAAGGMGAVGQLEAQRYLDLALDYSGAGFWEEASAVLTALLEAKGEGAPVYPMVLYALGYLAFRQGHDEQGQTYYRLAAAAPPDYCFPARLEEMVILQHALTAVAGDARARYYLGNLYYDKKRHEEAIVLWEAATCLEPSFAIPWRNLGVAYANVRRDRARACACYERALAANPGDARLLSELDQLRARMGVAPAQRLAWLGEHPDLVAERDDLVVAQSSLCNLLGQPQRALELLSQRRFSPWEGGEGRVSAEYEAAHVQLGERALETGDAAVALAHFWAAATYPDSLGEGKGYAANEAHLDFRCGLALEALGQSPQAQASFEKAAQPVEGLLGNRYYRALALRKLGREAAAQEELRQLLGQAQREREEADKPGFATSVPAFVFYEEDPARSARIACAYLVGLAYQGLGDLVAARRAFQEVLAEDNSHLQAWLHMRQIEP